MAITETNPQTLADRANNGGNLLKNVRSTKAKREIVEYAEEQFKKARGARMAFERQWYMNLAFYFGKHYAKWMGTTALGSWTRLYEPRAPEWRVRMVVNKTRVVVRAELAKVTKEKPRGFVIPATTDDADRAAAVAAEQIVEHLHREKMVYKVVRRAEFWNLLTGTSFIKDWYDKDRAANDGVKGDIMLEAVSPFHLFVPEMQEEELENQPFLIHAVAKSPEWLSRTFDVELSPSAASQGDILSQQFLGALGIGGQKRDMVPVKEAWIRPCRKFKDGAVVLWAEQELLNVSEGWPYKHGEYPFSKLEHIPTGRFYGDSTIVDLIPLQKEYNRTHSQIIEAKNRMAKPQLIAARGSIDPNKITSEPGLVILYTPGFQPPSPIPLTPLPTYVMEEVDRIQRDMDDVSSQHEVSKGRTPPGVEAATAISYLQEEDDSKLSYTVASLEEAVEKVTRHFLSHVNQFWVAQRIVRVVGDNGQYESFMFSKSDIKGNSDFRVEAGSATPRSTAAKQAFIMELGKMEWIPPQQALRYLNMAETGKLYEEMQLDSRQAQRENLRISQGEKLPINDYDNHAVHDIEHANFCKTQQFEALEDLLKTYMMEHRQMHKQMMAQAAGVKLPPGDPQLNQFTAGDPTNNAQAADAPPVPSPGEQMTPEGGE